jgi:hypothetical protein
MTTHEGAGRKIETICPESTIDSSNARNTVQKISRGEFGGNGKKLACESTIESANRRNFIRKAVVLTAAAGVGSLLVGNTAKDVFAKPALCCAYVGVCFAVWGDANYGCLYTNSEWREANVLSFGPYTALPCCQSRVSGQAIGSARKACSPNLYGLDFYTNYLKRVSITNCGKVGIGTCAPSSTLEVKGTGIVAVASESSAIPIVARRCYPSSIGAPNLQQWQNCAGKPLTVVDKCGWIGIGTCSPGSALCVVGGINAESVTSEQVIIQGPPCFCALAALPSGPQGILFGNRATSGDKSTLVRFQNACSTPITWNAGVSGCSNALKVPKGSFYVQHSTSTTPGISVNKCNHVGIGIANPCRVLCVNGRIHTSCGMGLGTQTINTTLAVNGSVSMKSRQVKTATALTLSDYAVLASASSAAFTITLPAISSTAGACNGMILFIKKIDSTSNSITIAASGTDTIEGSGSVVLKKQFDSLTLISNNSNSGHEWFILAGVKCGAVYS